MSHRRKRTVAQEKVVEQEDLSKYDSGRRDAFYGALLGAAIASLVIAARNEAVLTVFAIGYLFVFSIMLLGIKIRTKPIRFGRAFIRALITSGAVFGAIATVLSLLS